MSPPSTPSPRPAPRRHSKSRKPSCWSCSPCSSPPPQRSSARRSYRPENLSPKRVPHISTLRCGFLQDVWVALHRATKWQSICRQLRPNLPAEVLRKPVAQPPVVIKPLRRSIPLIGFASAAGYLRPVPIHVPIRRENG